MANTSELKRVDEYVIEHMSNETGIKLEAKKVPLGNEGKTKEFSGVSPDASMIVQIVHNSGYTSGDNLPTGKIKNAFANCYFLCLTKAEKKVLVITDKEFYKIFKIQSAGLLCDIELKYIELPDALKEITKRVIKNASDEMSK